MSSYLYLSLDIKDTLLVLQGMFGGGIFAFGKDTSIKLRGVELSNNTAAAAGGAVATFGGSSVKCSRGCSFKYNRAKVCVGSQCQQIVSVEFVLTSFLSDRTQCGPKLVA